MERIKMVKIMKSEPCPCGSGKKFRACCFNKSNQNKIDKKLLNSDGYINHLLNSKRKEANIAVCLHPNKDECKGNIKNAHSIQNNRILNQISEDGHVVLLNSEVKNGEYIVNTRDVSRNKATTFTGFCDYHDTNLFKPIETAEFEKTNEQLFLYAYRSLCLELHRKMVAIKLIQLTFKEQPELVHNPDFVYNYRMFQLGLNDLEKDKAIFDDALLKHKFDILYTRVYEFPFKINFATSTCFSIEYDLTGTKIVDIYDYRADRIPCVYFTAFPDSSNEVSYIIMSCLSKDKEIYQGLLDQIYQLDNDEKVSFFNNVLPYYTENIVMNPKLWRSFSKAGKQQLISKFQSDLYLVDRLINNRKELLKPTKYNLFKII
jgi:SEC-C motif